MTNQPSDTSNSAIVSLAVVVHRQGHLKEAEELYRRVLETDPKQVDALHFLGVLSHQRGEANEAIELIQAALRVDPNYVDARINLGNVLKETGRLAEAEREYRKSIEARPGSADAWNNLGTVFTLQKNYDQAIDAYEQAVGLAPQHADAFHNLGNVLKSAGRTEEALTAYRRAIEINPRHTDANLNLGRALYRFGRIDEAATVYAKWLEIDPANPIAAHMVAACTGGQIPERCSNEFVQQSFDAFAVSFDEVLTRLMYRVPELIGKALEAELSEPARQYRILDAGCGTGLCATWLRPYAHQLVGIDLAPKMVNKARAVGSYDEFCVAELTAYMLDHPASYDVIVAADTLVYFGTLAPVFQAAAAALRPQGVLCFTLEVAEEEAAKAGYRLNPHGRYSHTQSFVVTALTRAGLTVSEIKRDTLRLEMKQPVDGFVITARK